MASKKDVHFTPAKIFLPLFFGGVFGGLLIKKKTKCIPSCSQDRCRQSYVISFYKCFMDFELFWKNIFGDVFHPGRPYFPFCPTLPLIPSHLLSIPAPGLSWLQRTSFPLPFPPLLPCIVYFTSIVSVMRFSSPFGLLGFFW